MKQLWAPWRMAYIAGEENSPEEGCIFCIREIRAEDRKRRVLRRGEHSFVIMNKYPYSNGHLLIAPYRHIADLNDLTENEALEMHRLLVLCRNVLQEKVSPHGFNVGMNLGRESGAGVADHLHMHIVPRWSGDTNFMPVFSDVRVIPQHIEATYELLAQAFDEGRP